MGIGPDSDQEDSFHSRSEDSVESRSEGLVPSDGGAFRGRFVIRHSYLP